jgi:hypothetical protein
VPTDRRKRRDQVRDAIGAQKIFDDDEIEGIALQRARFQARQIEQGQSGLPAPLRGGIIAVLRPDAIPSHRAATLCNSVLAAGAMLG